MALSPNVKSYTIIQKVKEKRKQLSGLTVAILLILSVTASFFWNPFSPAKAEEVLYDSAFRIGSTSADVGYGIAADENGNIYISGAFNGTVDFDPDAGTTNLISSGSTDVYVAKYSSAGALIWAKNFGAAGSDYSYALAIDDAGNVYTTGYFSSTVDFDPGAGTANLASAGNDDIFVSKLDTDGNYVWARNFGGINYDYGYSIRADASGNVYTTGNFSGTADFDPGAGTANHVAVANSDNFVSKLDSDGNYLWSAAFGGTGYDNSYSIALDSDGNSYTTGSFTGTVDFDPGAGTANIVSAGNNDTYISKLDSSGNYVWAKNLGGTSADNGQAITVDEDGFVYTTGVFAGTADFDPNAGVANLVTIGSGDIFVSKLDSNGDYVWAKNMGSTGFDIGYGIGVDEDGGVYTTGTFRLTADFNPDAVDAYDLNSLGQTDMFVSKLDSGGDFAWAQGFGGTNIDSSVAMYVNSQLNVYTIGAFIGTVDFDPGAGTSNLVSAGSQDVFVSTLTQIDVPLVATEPASAITQTTATIQGDINNTGNLDITDRGFDYGLTAVYTDQVGEVGTFGTGNFTADLTGLTCNTTYHYRAYATNSQGTDTGSDETFTTAACAATPSGGSSSSGSRIIVDDEPTPGLQMPPDSVVVPPVTPPVTPPPTPTATPAPPASPPSVIAPVLPPTAPVITPEAPNEVPSMPVTPQVAPPRTETPRTITTPPAERTTSSDILKSFRQRTTDLALLTLVDMGLLIPLLPISEIPLLVLLAFVFLGLGALRMLILHYRDLLSFLGLRKRRKVWGTVYDSKNKQPLDPAVVELINMSNGEVQERAITDLAGRFGFLVTPGTFKIRASKTHYAFPSQNEPGQTDEIYDHLYHGEEFTIQDESSVITPNIPMDPIAYDWNQEAKRNYLPASQRLQYVLLLTLNILFGLGFIFAILNFFISGGLWNTFVLLIYIAIFIVGQLLKKRRLWGRLTKGGKPVSGAKIELTEPQIGVIMGKSLTMPDGKFFLKVPRPGQYKIAIKFTGSDEPYWQGDISVGKENVLNSDINL